MDDQSTSSAAPDAELPSLEEARGWIGNRVDDIRGSAVAKVEGLLVDADADEPAWILVRLGRFGHYSVLPFAHAVGGAGRVWVPYDRDLIRRTPRVEPGSSLSRDQELVLCSHYGIPESTGRAATIAEREGDAVTAKPHGG